MIVKFLCTTDDKKNYYAIKAKINFNRATIIRERVRDLKNDFYTEIEVVSHGRTLYRDLKQSGLCKNLFLRSKLTEEDDLE
jgi:hypothetical protein